MGLCSSSPEESKETVQQSSKVEDILKGKQWEPFEYKSSNFSDKEKVLRYRTFWSDRDSETILHRNLRNNLELNATARKKLDLHDTVAYSARGG